MIEPFPDIGAATPVPNAEAEVAPLTAMADPMDTLPGLFIRYFPDDRPTLPPRGGYPPPDSFCNSDSAWIARMLCLNGRWAPSDRKSRPVRRHPDAVLLSTAWAVKTGGGAQHRAGGVDGRSVSMASRIS